MKYFLVRDHNVGLINNILLKWQRNLKVIYIKLVL
jgi:hypothetical protein